MGRAIIERLAAAGCNVMLHGLVKEEVMQVPVLSCPTLCTNASLHQCLPGL